MFRLTNHHQGAYYCTLLKQSTVVSSLISAWRDLPGHGHGKLFIGRPCKKRADDLLNP